MEDFKEDMKVVNYSYENRKKQEEVIWKGFGKQVDELTNKVSEEFRKTLDVLSPTIETWKGKTANVDINNFKVEYDLGLKNFRIEIMDWSVDDDSQNWCAYFNMKGILSDCYENPIMKQFRGEYYVREIYCDCYCGSDHK